ncbi:MAG: hypothetical protein WC822_06510 [Candidatus Paceibacterota bacterium]|jgi:hypothetical protein
MLGVDMKRVRETGPTYTTPKKATEKTDEPQTSKYLIDDKPHIVLPILAVAVGLNHAIFLQQLHFFLQGSQRERDGRMWVYNTYDGWAEVFPYWNKMTIRRIISALESQGILLSRKDYNRLGFDQTKWYSIDYTALNKAIDNPETTRESIQDIRRKLRKREVSMTEDEEPEIPF